MSVLTESVVEQAAFTWLEALGYAVLHGPAIAAGEPAAERNDPNYRDVVLEDRLRQALVRLNPELPPEALEDAYRKLTRADAPSLLERNHALHRMLVDGATVPIYYESRLAKLELKESERPKIDPEFEEATEGEEVERKERLKSKWAQLEAVVGSENRIRLIARDLVEHFENRLATMDGKAMVVCMSRRICVELYREIVALRPTWHFEADDQGALKVVMTGSASDPMAWQAHIRNKPRRELLAQRFRAPADPFRIVIVRAVLAKSTPGERKTDEELDHAIRQIISKAMVSDEVVDLFAAAGLKKPDISILSDEFLAEVRGMPQRNLAVELLQKLLKGEIRTRSKRNVVQARSFAELLEQSVRKYQNRAIRENVRAQLRVLVKRILRKYGYPPDKQEKATNTVLEQAEVWSEAWAVA